MYARVVLALAIGAMFIVGGKKGELTISIILAIAYAIGVWIAVRASSVKPRAVSCSTELWIFGIFFVVVFSIGIALNAFEYPLIQIGIGIVLFLSFAAHQVLTSSLHASMERGESEVERVEASNTE